MIDLTSCSRTTIARFSDLTPPRPSVRNRKIAPRRRYPAGDQPGGCSITVRPQDGTFPFTL